MKKRVSPWEKRMTNILIRLKLRFEREKHFKSLGRCRFDFYLPKQRILIECDGKQHFYRKRKFHKTIAAFKHYQENDCKKNLWVYNNGYRLLRIAYKDMYKAESLLTRFIVNKRRIGFSSKKLYKVQKSKL